MWGFALAPGTKQSTVCTGWINKRFILQDPFPKQQQQQR